ncbi:hypothetical protein LTR97_000614 [Elasticomyces elasticus]|uniref:Uncharacterized protein n=1 Tax=Elasticomyces elasticus TaxID=574655 RepID=A0AAN8A5Y6_9PEZI|nr:hypothetical protein LTR97_000614 [Elasticomyces elasticus]
MDKKGLPLPVKVAGMQLEKEPPTSETPKPQKRPRLNEAAKLEREFQRELRYRPKQATQPETDALVGTARRSDDGDNAPNSYTPRAQRKTVAFPPTQPIVQKPTSTYAPPPGLNRRKKRFVPPPPDAAELEVAKEANRAGEQPPAKMQHTDQDHIRRQAPAVLRRQRQAQREAMNGTGTEEQED